MPEETRDQWLSLAGKICQTSKFLEHLIVKNTATSQESGAAFLQELAGSEITTLKEINFSGGKQVMI